MFKNKQKSENIIRKLKDDYAAEVKEL